VAVTRDPFLVDTSNIFAMLGLRSLYFLLVGVVARVRYLCGRHRRHSALRGGQMLLESWIPISAGAPLASS
jgi:tellurite resistance protein TerC